MDAYKERQNYDLNPLIIVIMQAYIIVSFIICGSTYKSEENLSYFIYTTTLVSIPFLGMLLYIIIQVNTVFSITANQDFLLLEISNLINKKHLYVQQKDIIGVKYLKYDFEMDIGSRGVQQIDGGTTAWTVSGDEAIKLSLNSGNSIIIGTKKANDLITYINQSINFLCKTSA